MKLIKPIFMIRTLTLTLLVSLAACAENENGGENFVSAAEPPAPIGATMEVFKQASCGCCGKWIEHMENSGHVLSVKNATNLGAIKAEFGIAPRYQSCHTAVSDNYVFEGHVPAAIVEQFLNEKPADALGLAVPGMPVGSPGMEMGDRFDEYEVLLLKKDGSSEVYARVTAANYQSL